MAFILILALAFPLRIFIPWGPFASFSPLDVVLLASLLGLLVRAFSVGAIRTGYRPIAIALFMPVLFCSFSLLWTVNPVATLKALVTYSAAMVAFLATVAIFYNFRSDIIANWLFVFIFLIILTAFSSAAGLPGLAVKVPPNLMPGSMAYESFLLSYHARLSHPFIGLSNNLATVLAFFPIILFSYSKIAKRSSFYWLALLCLLVIGLTLSRGVILALIFTCGFYTLCTRFSLQSLLRNVLALPIIITGAALFLIMNPRAMEHLVDRLSLINIEVRLEALHAVCRAIMDRPFLGYGAGVYIFEETDIFLRSTHNAFLSQFFYFGYPGGIVVAGAIFLIPILFYLWPLLNPRARFVRRAVVFSLVGQMIILLSQASFDGTVLRVLLYFSIGASIMLVKALEREVTFNLQFKTGA